jgi:hypothetical protein
MTHAPRPEAPDPIGTYDCPICGHDQPHGHTDEAVAAYHDDQIRNDGWTSRVVRMPDKSGYYLIKDFAISFDTESPRYANAVHLAKWRRPTWGNAPEVAEWSPGIHSYYFTLLYHPQANDRFELSFLPVLVAPKFWRPLP